MEEFLTRFMENIVGRVHGPMSLRFLLQPTMAIIFAIRDGRRDARQGKAPYGWALFTDPGHRRDLIHDGWKSVSKIFIIAVVLDAIYQGIVLKWFYPVEALVTACLLALAPYLLLRGAINRLSGRRSDK